jgi:hypothetical protein
LSTSIFGGLTAYSAHTKRTETPATPQSVAGATELSGNGGNRAADNPQGTESERNCQSTQEVATGEENEGTWPSAGSGCERLDHPVRVCQIAPDALDKLGFRALRVHQQAAFRATFDSKEFHYDRRFAAKRL